MNFVQHASEQQQPFTNGFRSVNQIQQNLPKVGSALKTGGGNVLFTLELKEIMIEFYHRQANYDICTNPAECIAACRI